MSEQHAYTYTILRYVHDTTTGEFVNVGVALHSPEARFVGALCRSTYGRLNKVFPGINAEHFKSLMRYIQGQFEMCGERLRDQLALDGHASIMGLARTVLPNDDSSLQWSTMGAGRSADPAATLEKLFHRLVTKYDERTPYTHRDENEVWRHFRRTLEARQILRYFEPHTIAVQDDEVEFKHAWKNGVWHCLEPVSFDLASADSIREKAHRWLGRITSVASANATEPFKMYFLVGSPQDEALTDAFESALSILNKVTVDKTIVKETDADQFSQRLSAEVEQHHATAN